MEQEVKTQESPDQQPAPARAAPAAAAAAEEDTPSGETPPSDARPGPLVSLTSGVWCADSELRLPAGGRLPLRSVALRLGDGGLLVYSPVALTDELASQIEALGEVRYLVAPNAYHHLHIASWQERFPRAETCAPARTVHRRPELSIDRVIDGSRSDLFGPSVYVEVMGGAPRLDEIALYHRPSRTLVLADILFNIREARGATKWLLRAMGTYGRAAPSRLMRLLIRDRAGFQRSVDRLRQFEIDRLIVAHGESVEGPEVGPALDRLRAAR